MDELKPCPVPWCERVNKPEVYNPAPEGCCVACPDCGLETNAFATEAEAIAAWNTRPTHEPAPELVEAMARAIICANSGNATADHARQFDTAVWRAAKRRAQAAAAVIADALAERDAEIARLTNENSFLAAGACINPGEHGLIGDEQH